MKIKFVTSILAFFTFASTFGQTASQVLVLDTRFINDAPDYFKNEVRFDFKGNVVLGLPPGYSPYSGVMTMAPWKDQSGGLNHQLDFHSEGLFYRSGNQENNLWGVWKKLAFSELNGTLLSESGGPGLRMKPGNLNETYIEFYARSANPNIRSAWLGFGAPLDNSIGIVNEIVSGNINIKTNNGKVGIDTDTPDAKLTVNGNLSASEIKVEVKNWPDYIFESGYKPMSLKELAVFINENKHLPNIPSAETVEKDGLLIGEISKKLLEKVEELTLYILDQNIVINSQQERLIILEKKMKELKN